MLGFQGSGGAEELSETGFAFASSGVALDGKAFTAAPTMAWHCIRSSRMARHSLPCARVSPRQDIAQEVDAVDAFLAITC
jgi:hypothetical protein